MRGGGEPNTDLILKLLFSSCILPAEEFSSLQEDVSRIRSFFHVRKKVKGKVDERERKKVKVRGMATALHVLLHWSRGTFGGKAARV